MAAPTPMSVDEMEKKEEEEFRTGPLSVLTTSVKTNSQARTSHSRMHQFTRIPSAAWVPLPRLQSCYLLEQLHRLAVQRSSATQQGCAWCADGRSIMCIACPAICRC